MSGKVSGRDNYEEDFKQGARELEEMGYVAVNPCELRNFASIFNYEDFMAVDFLLIDLCDGVYFLNTWEDSEGARRELGYAMSKKKEVMYQ